VSRSPREIGEILKEARDKKGLTVEKAAKTLQVQPKIIRALEEGTADETLSKVYAVLFLKRYASFLFLDADSLSNDYKIYYPDEKVSNFDVVKESPGLDDDQMQKWMGLSIAVISVFALIFFIMFVGAKLASFSGKKVDQPEKPKKIQLAVKTKQKTENIFPIPKNSPVILTLKSNEDAWMKTKVDGNVVFEGILKKGETKKWSASDEIDLWVGRAESLSFTINGKFIGQIGRGRIKSIQILRYGLKVENKWFLKAE